MSIVELERPSPSGTATRRAVSARTSARRAVESPAGQKPFDDLAVVFPSRRLGCAGAAALARRRRPGFDALASSTAWLIAEGLESLEPDRRLRILLSWQGYRDHGPRLVGDSGCDVRLGRERAGTAERAALLAWLPLADRELAVYDGGLFETTPARAVSLLLRPPTIWSCAEALLAERLFPRSSRFEPERFAALEQHAHARVQAEHLTRLHRALARIAAQLPAEAFPVAGATVAAGCLSIADDERRARAVVARQLARYASSALVAGLALEAG